MAALADFKYSEIPGDWTFSFRKQKVLSWDSELQQGEVMEVYKAARYDWLTEHK